MTSTAPSSRPLGDHTPDDASTADDSTGDDAIPFVHHFVGGARRLQQVERWGSVSNPSSGKAAAAVPFATAGEVGEVVRDSRRAFAEWSRWSALRRARVMFRFKELIETHIDELARLISNEHGKVFLDAKGEVQRGLEVVEFACGIPHLMKGADTRWSHTIATSERGFK